MSSLMERFKGFEPRFGQREKVWGLFLAAVMVVVWGSRVVLKPRAEAFREARRDSLKAHDELIEMEAQKPDMNELRARIRQLQSQVGSSYKELDKLEKGLLYSQDQDLLLERLVADRKRYDLQINAVEPIREDAQKTQQTQASATGASRGFFYKQLLVKVDASATYNNLSSYVKVLEGQGSYQKVRGVKVEMDKDEKALPRAKVLIEVLLSDAPMKKAEMRDKVFSMIEEEESAAREAKDPFLAQERPREEEEMIGLELTGIFGVTGRLTALIDGNAYQEGDVIQGKRIVKILSDKVVFEHGNKRYFLHESPVSQ